MNRRIVWLAVSAAAAGFTFSSAFGYRAVAVPVLAAVIIPTIAITLLHRVGPGWQPWTGLLVGALLWFLVAVALLFHGDLAAHGPVHSIATAVSASRTVWGRLGATLPALARPDALIAPFTVTWGTTVLAMAIRLQAKAAAAALLPPAAGIVSAMLLCTPQTAGSIVPAVVFAGAAAVDLSVSAHVTLLTGFRPQTGTAVLAVACVVAAAFLVTSVSWLDEKVPYDPHRHSEAPLPSAVLDPLAQEALWASQPHMTLFRTATTAPNGWVIAYLDDYNGVQWQPSGRFTPAASLAYLSANRVRSGELARQKVQIAAMTGPYLPLPIQVVSITGIPVQYSSHDDIAIAQNSMSQGTSYFTAAVRARAGEAAGSVSGAPGATAQSIPDGMPNAVNSLIASVNAGLPSSATPPQRAAALAHRLITRYSYRPGDATDQTLGGLRRLLTSREGSAAAFVSLFALAVRTLGVPSRVAVGFASGRRQADGSDVVSGADARVWDDIYFVKTGWVAVNVLPKATQGPPDGLVPPAASTPRPSASPSPSAVASAPSSPKPSLAPSRSARVGAERNGGLAVPRIAWAALFGVLAGLCILLRCYQVLVAPKLRRRKARKRRTAASRAWGAWQAAAADTALRALIPPGTIGEPKCVVTALPPRARTELAPTLSALTDLAFHARYGEPTSAEAKEHKWWLSVTDEEADRAWQIEEEIAARSRDLAGWPGSIGAQLVPWTAGIRSDLVRRRNTPAEVADR